MLLDKKEDIHMFFFWIDQFCWCWFQRALDLHDLVNNYE